MKSIDRAVVFVGKESRSGEVLEFYQLLAGLEVVGTNYDGREPRNEFLAKIASDFSKMILRECNSPVRVDLMNGHQINADLGKMVETEELESSLAKVFYNNLDNELAKRSMKISEGNFN